MDPYFRVLQKGAEGDLLVADVYDTGPGMAGWAENIASTMAKKVGEDYYDVIISCGDVKRHVEPQSFQRQVFTSRKHECREDDPTCTTVLEQGVVDIAALVNPFEVATNRKLHQLSRRTIHIHIPSPVLYSAVYQKFDALRFVAGLSDSTEGSISRSWA
jgi:adenylylsulfate kinase-like enzyme